MNSLADDAQRTMKDIAISVRNVSKCYRVFEHQGARLRHAFIPSSTKGVSEVWALTDISFEVKRGESVAIIGRNGSGKSTLLEIITGTLTPTGGSVQVNGRIAALLELGSGFNPQYTGRENVFLNGLLLGLSRSEVENRFDDIVNFADIGDVLDRPVKTYSSGMLVRLAFAVQIALDPDILIVDEALSVGDFFFQQKCLGRIRQLQSTGTTILFVSHDMQTVRDLCQLGLFLQVGAMKFWGDNLTAINRYLSTSPDAIANTKTQPQIHTSMRISKSNEDSRQLLDPIWRNEDNAILTKIIEVGTYTTDGIPTLVSDMGKALVIKVRYRDCEIEPSHVTLTLRNRYDQTVTAIGTYTHNINFTGMNSAYIQELVFTITLNLEAGEYSFQFNIGRATGPSIGIQLHESPWLGPIQVAWDYQVKTPPFFGMFGLPISISHT